MNDQIQPNAGPLFDDMTQSRMLVELRFAFDIGIDPELCTTVIDELGGYEFIRSLPGDCVASNDWLQRAIWNKDVHPISIEHDLEWKGEMIRWKMSAPISASDTIPPALQPLVKAYSKLLTSQIVKDLGEGKSLTAHRRLEDLDLIIARDAKKYLRKK